MLLWQLVMGWPLFLSWGVLIQPRYNYFDLAGVGDPDGVFEWAALSLRRITLTVVYDNLVTLF